jgi:Ion channel
MAKIQPTPATHSNNFWSKPITYLGLYLTLVLTATIGYATFWPHDFVTTVRDQSSVATARLLGKEIGDAMTLQAQTNRSDLAWHVHVTVSGIRSEDQALGIDVLLVDAKNNLKTFSPAHCFAVGSSIGIGPDGFEIAHEFWTLECDKKAGFVDLGTEPRDVFFGGSFETDAVVKNSRQILRDTDGIVPIANEATLRDFLDEEAGGIGNGLQRWLRLGYFSIITATTIGYGDVVPRSDAARIASASEGLLGVIIIGSFLNALAKRRP